MTLPEKRLWAELRKLDLNIRRQAPIGRYVADFACHPARLVIELDGPRDDLEASQLHDHERTQWLESQGFRVLRFRHDEALGDPWGVAEQIAKEIRASKALPLDGGGLGGGVSEAVTPWIQVGADAHPGCPPQPCARTPIPDPSPIEGEGGFYQPPSSTVFQTLRAGE
ncbi:MAG: endonuclease domain-containing protein [Phenylobacterium sp.]|nr:endonuclease domain-containing protein [Phenylobacterium sp.]MBP7815943.1 endonuclease domain-containing protein [Phenylobacterium sp.]MBP9230108.1 endonuclease domain-containing protein [Phenylobacterium sp.]MBP9756718.1 endonuclease domain-containing protein [Phenylobacterium sp.]